jgi:2-polyprenyl-3-methyl-5-hydroxy-6-metoxy-1,4-benzoquinol methylase
VNAPGTKAGHWQAKWQRRYAEREFLFGTAPNAFLQSQSFRLRAGMRALCPGEGEGRNAVWLARQGLPVTAVDFAPAALEHALALAARERVAITTIEADLSRWAWPRESFDLVVLTFVQLPEDERVPVHAGAAAALAPGGLLLLEGFAKGERLGCGPPTDDARYDAAMLRADFSGLEVLELMAGTTTLHEGTGHQGAASVVRLVARKSAP